MYEDADDVNVNGADSLTPTDFDMVDNDLYAATNDARMENNVNKLLHRDLIKEGVDVNPDNLFMEDNCVYESTQGEHGGRSKKKQEGDVTCMIDNDLYNTTR